MNSYDLVVIGAGPGGYVAAIRGAQKNLKTAVIECREVGGTCLNRGCIPTKSMIHSAHLYKETCEGQLFGLVAKQIGFDFDIINQRKGEVVTKLRSGVEQLLKANKITLIQGRAMIKDEHTIMVDGMEEISAQSIIIAAGSRPNQPPAFMRGLENVITSDEALSEKARLYKRILILGGGVIGVEFANIYNDLGCEVTIVEMMDNLLFRLDGDICKNTTMLLKKRGVNILTSASLEDVQQAGGELLCRISLKGGIKELTCDGALVCVGRAPLTEGLAEPSLCLKLNERGFIPVNSHMQTNISNIYAIGDCTEGSIQLAHAASAQGLNAISHIVGEKAGIDMRVIPSCVYTSPEIAAVGLTEEEASQQGITVETGKYLMAGNGKSIITNEERGFIKLVFNAETKALIGAHLMCARATDIIGELSLAISQNLTAEQLSSVIRPHPTYMEGVTEAVEDIFGLAVHMAPRKK